MIDLKIVKLCIFIEYYGIIDNVKRLYNVLILCDTILILKLSFYHHLRFCKFSKYEGQDFLQNGFAP